MTLAIRAPGRHVDGSAATNHVSCPSRILSRRFRQAMSSSLKRMRWIGFAIVLAGTLSPGTAWCLVGKEISLREFDLSVTIDSRWAGCAYGGYYPVRVRVVNRGPARTLTFRFTHNEIRSRAMPEVARTVQVDQNATVQFTLSIPMVSQGSTGRFDVLENGRRFADLSTQLSLSEPGIGEVGRTSLLVISGVIVDCGAFEVAAAAMGNSAPGAGHAGGAVHHGRYGAGASVRAEDHVVLPPVMLPEAWIDYSGLDIIALSLKTFDKLAPAVREAILKWTECGGTLLIDGVGKLPDQSEDLTRLLQLERFRKEDRSWRPADLSLRMRLTQPAVKTPGVAPTAAVQEAEALSEIAEEVIDDRLNGFLWADPTQAFMQQRRMAGKVFAFPADAFPGSPSDWSWFLKSVGQERWLWKDRTGIASRQGSSDFNSFLIPGVGGVPVFAFLGLITLFTIVIGPVNYFWLWRRRQLFLLVITIPAIAFLTTCSLFAYASLADGFGASSRLLSVTLLDQGTKSAVAASRLSLYAGMAPSSGLTFPLDDAVFPIWPEGDTFESGRVNSNNHDQRWTSGWFRSRTRTQFFTLAHRVERGRLEIKAGSSAESLDVVNGFPWKIRRLLVKSAAGDLYLSPDALDAGAGASLQKTTVEDAQVVLKEILDEHPFAPPDVLAGNERVFGFRSIQYYMNQPDNDQTTRFMKGQLTGRLDGLRRPEKLNDAIQPGTYVAIFAENPGNEAGLKGAVEQASLHVLFGRY